jgi:DNA-binding protein Fis
MIETQILFDEFPDGIAVFSRKGEMVLRNKAFERLIFEGGEQDVRSSEPQYLKQMLANKHEEEALITALMRNRVARSFPLTFKLFDGSEVDTEVSAVADLRADRFVLHVREILYTRSSQLADLRLSRALEALLPQPSGEGLLERVSATTEILERYYIERALTSVKGNRAAAARKLGLSRQSLYVKLNRYGIGESSA